MSGAILQRRRLQMAVLIAAALLLVPALGLPPLFDIDEGAFGEATREMLASGDWLSTTLNGAPRFDKPILIYWLQAACVATLGLNEFALRLPSALAALAWIGTVGRFVSPRLDAGTGELAAWIAATCIGVTLIAHAATADALLNALLAAAMLDAWRHIDGGERRPLLRMYVWIGLGVLTKGPIAALIPVAVTLLYALLARRMRDWRRAAFDPAGWLLLAAIIVPWYGYALHRHGSAFIEGFFVKHNLQRFGGTLEGHSGSLVYYVVAVPLLLLPWTGLLAPALRAVRLDWSTGWTRYLWLWFVFVFGFFSASGTKLPHYVLYGLTPLFILMALHRNELGTARLARVIAAIGLAALPSLPWLVQRWGEAAGAGRTAYYAALAQRSLEAAPASYYAVTGCACALGIVALTALPGPGWRRLAAAAGLLTLALQTAVAPWLGEVLSGPVKRAAQFVRARPENVVQWNLNVPSFSVYRRSITESRPPRPGELAITRADRLPKDANVQVLFDEGGVMVVSAQAPAIRQEPAAPH
ncbi:MAG: glycosyltransferase family 39 protein [Burkholderiaceae bacterium]|nr:glycosyltransferase family 39 protein [Burkholderiaceae bacterium]